MTASLPLTMIGRSISVGFSIITAIASSRLRLLSSNTTFYSNSFFFPHQLKRFQLQFFEYPVQFGH